MQQYSVTQMFNQHYLGSFENAGIDWASAMAPMIGTIQVIGLIAFLRGWLLITKSYW